MSKLVKNMKKTGVYQSQLALYQDKAKFESQKNRFIHRATRIVRYSDKLYYNRGRIISGAFSLVVPLLVTVFICRMLFSNGTADVSPHTLFLDVLQRFSSQNWNVDYLMWTISNFGEISAWATDTSGILEALKTIVSIFGYIGNILLLITALIVQAGAVITFMFSVLTGA